MPYCLYDLLMTVFLRKYIFPRSNHNSIEKLISKKRGYHLNKNETCTKIISEVTLKKITTDIWRCLLIAHGS